jgi:hypothetical protein
MAGCYFNNVEMWNCGDGIMRECNVKLNAKLICSSALLRNTHRYCDEIIGSISAKFLAVLL